jgi:uncharacterized protein YjiS (DUF1127 family)
MDTIYFLVRLSQTVPTRGGLSLSKRCWSALMDWREREKLRSRLIDLSDAELRDIGITRSEVDYVAANRSDDPRGFVGSR